MLTLKAIYFDFDHHPSSFYREDFSELDMFMAPRFTATGVSPATEHANFANDSAYR
jgi:hypothetical protein